MGLLTFMCLRLARQDGGPIQTVPLISVRRWWTVACGTWRGGFVSNRNPKEFALIQDFLFRQARFRHLKDEDVAQLPERDMEWTMIRKS